MSGADGSAADADGGPSSWSAVFRRPAVVVTGLSAALATAVAVGGCLSGVALLYSLGVDAVWLQIAGGVLAYDATAVLTAPVVRPGLVATVTRSGDRDLRGGLLALGEATRTRPAEALVAALSTRLAAYGFTLLLAPVVLGVVSVLATGGTILAYGAGVVRTPDPELYLFAVVGLALTVRAAGFVPVAFAESLARTVNPRRAWRLSAAVVRADPLGAGRIAAARVLLYALPLGGGVALVVFADLEGVLVVPGFVAGVVAVGLPTKPAEVLVVEDYLGARDGFAREAPAGRAPSTGRSLRALAPSRATVLALVLVAGLAVGSAGLRVSDYRPLPEPAPADVTAAGGSLDGDPGDLYAAARARTSAAARNLTTTFVDENVTTGERTAVIRSHLVVGVPTREASVVGWLREDDGSWVAGGSAYASDGFYVRSGGTGTPAAHAFHESRREDWLVYAAPQYATWARSFPDGTLPEADVTWDDVRVEDGTAVLTIRDPSTVEALVGRYDPERVAYRNESRIRVRVDLDRQRVDGGRIVERFAVYDSEARETVTDRHHSERRLRYRYGDVDVVRPRAVGPGPLALVWDLVYY